MDTNPHLDRALQEPDAEIFVQMQADVLRQAEDLRKAAVELAVKTGDERLLEIADIAALLIQCLVFGDRSGGVVRGPAGSGPGNQ